MGRRWLVPMAVMLLVDAAPPSAAPAAAPPLVPMPCEISAPGGFVEVTPAWRVVVETGAAADSAAAGLVVEEARACFGWTWRPGPARRGAPAVVLRARPAAPGDPPLFRSQGYRLRVDAAGVVIEAPTGLGRFYGVQTLRQLLRGARGRALPRLAIRDWPALEWRGVSDDVSRGQISTLADFKAIVRRLSYYKLNLYQPYLEDMFAFRAAPGAGRARGALTAGEMRALWEEGRRCHVEVVPILETLGHQERLLSQPAYRRYAATPPAARGPRWLRPAQALLAAWTARVSGAADEPASAPSCFEPGDPGVLAFVERLVDEVAAAAPGPFFHVGGDEAALDPDGVLGSGDPLAGRGRDVGRHLGALARHVEGAGRRMMVYGDLLVADADVRARVPRSVMVVDWRYDPADSFTSLARLRSAGFRDVLVSPGLWTWSGFYPLYERGFRSVRAFTAAGRRAGARGCVAAAWGDGGADDLRENDWTGQAFAGAAAWEAAAPGDDEFLRRYVAAQYGVRSEALARAEKLLGWQTFEGFAFNGRLYHRPPRVRTHVAAWLGRMEALRRDALEVRRLVASACAGARFERGHLESLDLAARRFLYAADRELRLDAAARALGDGPSGRLAPARQAELARTLAALRDEARGERAAYAALWLRRNRAPGLDANLARMGRQEAVLDSLLDRARHGGLTVEPWCPSRARAS